MVVVYVETKMFHHWGDVQHRWDKLWGGHRASPHALPTCMASSLVMPLSLFHASHLARASNCTASRWHGQEGAV